MASYTTMQSENRHRCGFPFSNHSGFTLIEILIVIVIISIVSTFAVLSISINQDKRLASLTHQLENIFTLAETEAIMRSATLGFVLNEENFQFYEYHPTKNSKDNPWHPLFDQNFKLHPLANDIKMTLKINNENITGTPPRLIISPSGETTPFIILIGKKNSSPRYRMRGEANGAITSERNDANE